MTTRTGRVRAHAEAQTAEIKRLRKLLEDTHEMVGRLEGQLSAMRIDHAEELKHARTRRMSDD